MTSYPYILVNKFIYWKDDQHLQHSCSFRQKSKYIQSQELFIMINDINPWSMLDCQSRIGPQQLMTPISWDLINSKKTLSVSNCSHADYSQAELSTNLTRGKINLSQVATFGPTYACPIFLHNFSFSNRHNKGSKIRYLLFSLDKHSCGMFLSEKFSQLI